MKKNEEIQLNALVSELKLDIKEKENTIKDLERELENKGKEYQANIDKLKNELSSKEALVKKVKEDKELTSKHFKEGSLMSRRLINNQQKEMRIMSGVFHNLAYEMLFKQQLNN